MNLKSGLSALVIGVAMLSGAHAEGFYVGVDYLKLKVDAGLTFKPSLLSVSLGNQFSTNFAVEGRLATNVASDTNGAVTAKVNNMFGVYAKGIIPFNDRFSMYGLLGYNRVKVSASSAAVSSSDTTGSASYGVGVNYSLTKEASLHAEWLRLGSDVSALGLGATYKY